MDYEFRPIVTWPGPPTPRRKRSAFRAGYNDTLGLLDTELRHLAARQIVIQLALNAADIRLDGRPRAGARPSHPGVILSFESRHGPLSYPCDRFDAWEDNLRAIALSLEHLRAVDRYGVTKRGEQYRGWTALPPPIITPPPMTVEAARAILAAYANGTPVTSSNIDHVYRVAVLATHPDRGGDAEKFKAVQRARELLKGKVGS